MNKYPELKKLKGRMVENGETYRSLCKKVGISLNSLNGKLNGYSLFDIAEVTAICSVLNIQPEEIPIFFAQDIAKRNSAS